jgi:hypothetical protein
MRRSPSVALSLLTVLALAVLAAGGTAQAGPSAAPTSERILSADLAVTGFVAGGETTVESSHPVVFVFTIKNNGPSVVDSSADLHYTVVRHGTVTDQLCILPSHHGFNADSPFCEPGQLKVGQRARMTLIVQPESGITGVRVSVRVCSSNESDIPDPVSGNNCLTLGVRI